VREPPARLDNRDSEEDRDRNDDRPDQACRRQVAEPGRRSDGGEAEADGRRGRQLESEVLDAEDRKQPPPRPREHDDDDRDVDRFDQLE
jgi:hypothetical protein